MSEINENEATKRLKAMIKAAEAGKLVLPNSRKDRSDINYDDIPDDITVYAGLPPDKQV